MRRASGLPEWLVHPDTDFVLIGHRADGRPIYQAAGAAADTIIDNWIPIEYDSEVIQRVMMDSAIERYAAPVPMATQTKEIPRSAGLTVTVGLTYSDDTSTNDKITLTARRFISRFQVDEDDLVDANTRMDVIKTKGLDWAISYADTFDNACLGVSATENGTTAPFTSAYKTLRTTDSGLSYTADDNYTTWDDDLINIASTPAGTSLYEKLSYVFKKVETGKYWSNVDAIVVAAPGWRDALRLCTDAQGRPIFLQGTAGTPDTLFGSPIAWSRGCKVAGSLSGNPSGNDLLYYVNKRYLRMGKRSGPETRADDPRAQDDADNYAVKFRSRRGFKLGHPAAAAVLERITD